MALTEIQRSVCRILAARRRLSGESYVAGGTALTEMTGSCRISRDVDIFHDTDEAVIGTWHHDRETLMSVGYTVEVVREALLFVEARIAKAHQSVTLQWARDSAFRFFPLLEHPDFGLTLHPFDHATNKVMALVGRLEVRDWVDVIKSCQEIQQLGYLAWAACGKDPGFSPALILQEAARSSRYSVEEVGALEFEGPPPDAGALSRQWKLMMLEAKEIVSMLPAETAGCAVLDPHGNLFSGDPATLSARVAEQALVFHVGHRGGAWPSIVS